MNLDSCEDTVQECLVCKVRGHRQLTQRGHTAWGHLTWAFHVRWSGRDAVATVTFLWDLSAVLTMLHTESQLTVLV